MESKPNMSFALYKWACGEMGLMLESHSTASSSGGRAFPTQDWNGICLGPMADIWMYVVSHVKSEKSVETMKGNLKLHSSNTCNEDVLKSMLMKRNKLQQEISELENQNKKLSDQLMDNRSKLALRTRYLTHYQSLVRDHKRSIFLLNILTTRIHHQISSLRDSSSISEAKISNFIPFRILDGNEDRYKIDVAKMSKLMQESLAELIVENPNLEKIQILKHEVGLCLATLLTKLPHPHFLKLLLECQEADVNKIYQLTSSRGDIDLHDLELINQSANSVQELVSNLSWFCVDQYNFSEKKGKVAESLKKQLLLLNIDIQQQLDQLFQGRDDMLKIARELVNLRVKYDSYEATLMALKKTLAEMQGRCSTMEINRDEVESTNSLIEKNSCLVEHYSTLICTLAKKHAENATLVDREITDLKCLLNDKAPSLRSSLVGAARSTRKNLERHEVFFCTFKSSKFHHSRVENELVPIESLTTNRLQHLSNDRISDNSVARFLEILSINHSFSTIQFLRTIGTTSSDIIRMRQAVKWYTTMMAEIAEKHKCAPFSEESFHYLVSAAKGKQKSVEEEIVPVVDSRLRKMEEASKFVLDVERAISDWSDEPAKFIETGCMVNGQTLEQWRKHLTKTPLNSNTEI